jgi:hypothetical protein
VLLVPFLLIQLSILRPSCDELSLIDYVRNVADGMQFGNSQNASKMRNWVMFVLATNQIVPNGKQVASRSIPALGQPIPVDGAPIVPDTCIICLEELRADNRENPLVINLNRNCTHKLHLDCAQRLIQNNLQHQNFPGASEMFNQQLHLLAACLVCMRGGGWAFASTRQLVERNTLGWRRKTMIRNPEGRREITEAGNAWRHRYLLFTVNGNETGRASVNFGEGGNRFVINAHGGYSVVSNDWIVVRNRDQWNKYCIVAKSPEHICLPTGNQLN